MNSYKSPADVPENYRKHPSLSKSFKADGSYVRPAEDPVTIWAIARRYQGRVAFIMVEAMEPGKKFEGAILTSGTNTKTSIAGIWNILVRFRKFRRLKP